MSLIYRKSGQTVRRAFGGLYLVEDSSCPINSTYGSKENALLTSFISDINVLGLIGIDPTTTNIFSALLKMKKELWRLCHVVELTKHFSIY